MTEPIPPSLAIVRAEVDRHVAEQVRRASEVDARAGLGIGFSGVLIGLARDLQNLLEGGAVLVAGLASVAGVVALWPRADGVAVGARAVGRYVDEDPGVTARALLDTQLVLLEEDEARLNRKSGWAKFSVGCVGISTGLMLAGTIVEFLVR